MKKKKRFFIGDLDGTLALNDHRQHWLDPQQHAEITDDERWQRFFLDCPKDAPNLLVVELWRHLYETHYAEEFHIFSGRSKLVEMATHAWLAKYLIPFDQLRMRETKDFRPDEIVKSEWLDDYAIEEIAGVLDDRAKVVAMWRARGVTCLQVAPGNF